MDNNDQNLLRWYMRGFTDELNQRTFIPSYQDFGLSLEYKAYQLGATHAIIGDDVRSVDKLSEEEILKMIKDG